MPLDRPVREEECGRDFLVRLALGDEEGNAFLRRSERAWGRGTAADPLELGTCTLGPERRTDALEHGTCFLERLAALPSSLQPALRGPESQQRAAAIQREVDACMPLQCLCEGGERSVEVARLRDEKPATARAVGECRDTLEPARIALVPVEELARRFRSPELDQSLDGVDHESEPSGLRQALVAEERHSWLEVPDRRFGISERERQVSERSPAREPCVAARARPDDLVRDRSRPICVTALGTDKALERAAE